MRLKLGAAAAAALVALASAAAAFAHAAPVTVQPGDGAVLSASPARVTITMSQELARQAGGSDIDVFDGAGREVTTEAATISDSDRRVLSVPLPASLPTGTYRVAWKTVSAEDGDTANGELSFVVDPAATPSAGRETVRESPLTSDETPAASTAAFDTGGGGGTSWVLVTAIAVCALAVGGGAMFLLGPRRQ